MSSTQNNCCSYSKKGPQREIIFECGFNPQDAFFEVDDGAVAPCQSFVLDRLVLDTSKLYKPLVRLEFTTLIVFEGESEEGYEHEVEVDLLFKLERTCNGHTECLQTWNYLKEFDVEGQIEELEIEISESFTGAYCDRPCSGCCEYRLVVEGKDFEGEFDELRISRVNFSAIAQGYSG